MYGSRQWSTRNCQTNVQSSLCFGGMRGFGQVFLYFDQLSVAEIIFLSVFVVVVVSFCFLLLIFFSFPTPVS